MNNCNVIIGEQTCDRVAVSSYRCKIETEEGETVEETVNVCDRHVQIIEEELKLQRASS